MKSKGIEPGKAESKPSRKARFAQLLAVLLTAGLAVVCFFSLMEIVLTLAATFIYYNVESAVRGKYALVTVRNFYLLGGGLALLAFVIGFVDYCVKRLGTERVWRLLAVALAVEAAVVLASWLVTG